MRGKARLGLNTPVRIVIAGGGASQGRDETRLRAPSRGSFHWTGQLQQREEMRPACEPLFAGSCSASKAPRREHNEWAASIGRAAR